MVKWILHILESIIKSLTPYPRWKVEQAFLESHVFYGLTNLNTGFDNESIYYFSKADFEIVMDRVEALGIAIFGIEPHPDHGACQVYEEYGLGPIDPKWYRAAFQRLVDYGIKTNFSASYNVPQELLDAEQSISRLG